MSEALINSFLGILIQFLTLFLIVKILLKKPKVMLSLKEILIAIVMACFFIMMYTIDYSSINTIFSFIVMVIGVLITYRGRLSVSIILVGLYTITKFVADFINGMILLNFLTIDQIRGTFFILSNILVSTITIAIIEIPIFKKMAIKMIDSVTTGENKDFLDITFVVIFIFSMSLIFHIISDTYLTDGSTRTLFIIGEALFLILSFIYFQEKYKRNKTNDRYEQLFEYVKSIEDWIDTEELNIHEYKNQLATLKGMLKNNPEALDYINNIVKEQKSSGVKNISNLKDIPKGGLKGLLYYKITVAEGKNVTLSIDVSKRATKYLKKLTANDNKTLCRYMGVFIDNAIEASESSKEKSVVCEIYEKNQKLFIAISNTFSGNIDLSKITKYGYSTKGKGRGKGLYLINKMNKTNETFKLQNAIINNYYVQTITVLK